jgi:hypothetical protein
LAKATWLTASVSPRAVWMPAAPATAARSGRFLSVQDAQEAARPVEVTA